MLDDASFRSPGADDGERVDDATLLRRYTEERNEEAFAELVRRHLDGVYSAALRRVGGDTHLAEDVAQQVFVALARKAAWLSRHPVLTGWLYLTTRHEAANAVRTERRRKAREQEAQVMHEILSEPVSEADWSRVAPVLDEVIDELGERDRTAILLRFVDRRPFGEIGATLRLTEDAARMRVERALDKLRVMLARRGIASSSAALGIVLANNAVVAAPAGLAANVTGAVLACAATGSGGVTATVIFFMKTKTILMSAAALLAIGFAAYECDTARRAESALAASQSESARLRRELAAAERRSVPLDQSPAASEQNGEATVPPAARRVATPDSPAQLTEKAKGDAMAKVLLALEKRRTVRGADRLDVYRSYVRQLGFSEAQVGQFRDLIIANQDVRAKALRDLTVQGAKVDVAALHAVDDQAKSNLMAAVGQTFGDTAAQAFAHYQETLPVRSLMDQLAVGLLYSDAPLTGGQADQLVEIVARNSRNAKGEIDLGLIDSEAVQAQAQGVLSASQFAAFRDLATQTAGQHSGTSGVIIQNGTTTIIPNPAGR